MLKLFSFPCSQGSCLRVLLNVERTRGIKCYKVPVWGMATREKSGEDDVAVTRIGMAGGVGVG